MWWTPSHSAGHAACTTSVRRRRRNGGTSVVAACTASTLLLAAGVAHGTSTGLSAAGQPLSAGGFNGLDDSILFGMEWASELPADLSKYMPAPMVIRGQDQEEYSCYLPKAASDDDDTDGEKEDEKPKPKALLNKIKDKCLRRLDVYWSYELCVDQHVRQYHEDIVVTKKGEKEKKVTEHFLGRSRKILTERGEADTVGSNNAASAATPTFQYDGKEVPYYTETYVGGDVCDLTGTPRTTEVRYICDKDALHAMGSMQETTTCNYLVVVHTSLLCAHPDFMMETVEAHRIACVPKGHVHTKPAALLELEAVRAAELQDIRARDKEEAAVRQAQKEKRAAKQKEAAGAGGSGASSASSASSSSAQAPPKSAAAASAALQEAAKRKGNYQKTFIQMLKGKHCFSGGTGWWHVEYCYGKHVAQVHRNEDGTKDVVTLGKWDGAHQKKMHKAASKTASIKGSKISYATQYLKNGDYCEDANAKRKVKVKLICAGGNTVGALKDGTVTLDLVETKTCEYTLKVVSPMMCPILMNVKPTDGMIDLTAPPEPSEVEKKAAAELIVLEQKAQAQRVAAAAAAEKEQMQADARANKASKSTEGANDAEPKPISSLRNLAASQKTLVKFLKGQHCFLGGQGWWQFEFCYKRHVRQIHRNDDGTEQVVRLGEWDAEYHRKKTLQSSSNGPKFTVAHFDEGDYCEASSAPRKTQVKMICSTKLTGGQVSLSLTEPKTCEYILKVESPMFCELLQNLGEDGLFDISNL